MGNNYVGILVNSGTYRGIPSGKPKQESLSCYEEAGKRYGITPCYIRLADLHPDKKEAVAFVKGKYGYVRKTVPIPRVIHNRALYFRKESHDRIKELVRQGIQIFNETNRYGKIVIDRILRGEPEVVGHLPETMLYTADNLKLMMQRHDALILKPNNASLGQGVIKLLRCSSGWRLYYPAGKAGVKTAYARAKDMPKAVAPFTSRKKYIIQQYIPLAAYNGRPFDLRVVVQRDGSGQWQVTGIIGKVAGAGRYITNVANGGAVGRIEQLLPAALPYFPLQELKERIEAVSLTIAKRMELKLPHLADLGFDIGITGQGEVKFIESNGCGRRYGFLKARMYDIWRATYNNPIAYADFLLRSGEVDAGGSGAGCQSELLI